MTTPHTHAAPAPGVPLNDGRVMPQVGFGVYKLDDETAPRIVGAAIDAGYRSIDTAAIYGNEAGVGRAIRESRTGRGELFVTTKLWNDGHGDPSRALDDSLARLGLDRVDLYLIHWPCPERGAYVEAWRSLIRLKDDGRATSIGVSNFLPEHLERIIGETGVTPAVNQVELHLGFQQRALRALHATLGIVTEAWSPLGQGKALGDPTLAAVARRHGRSPAQVALRWHIEIGAVAIPKSADPARIAENIALFDFALDAEDHAALATLDAAGGRIGPDPATFG